MSNTTDTSIILLINTISSELNLYLAFIVFLFGTTGNILNILVLSQSTLRSNPCVIYFLASSASSLGIILVGLPTRIIAGWTSVDPTSTNSTLCKVRIFFLYGFRTTTVWLMILASIDRWFSSSLQITGRRLSSCQLVYKGVTRSYRLSFLLWIEALYCYETNLPQAPLRCYGKSHLCRVFNDLVYATSTVIIPSFLMLIFAFLTIHNINRSHRAIQPFIVNAIPIDPLHTKKRKKLRRNPSSFTRMLLLQVIFLTVCSLPQAIHQFYLTFTIEIVKSPLRIAIENFIVNFNFSLTSVENASPFYICTLTGIMFRQALKDLVRSTVRNVILYISVVFDDLNDCLVRIIYPRVRPRH